MSNSTEKYIQTRIREIHEDLTNLPIHYPDTYGQALINWRRSTNTNQEKNLNR